MAEIQKPPMPESWEEAIAYIATVADALGWDIVTKTHPDEGRIVAIGVAERGFADSFMEPERAARAAEEQG